MIIVDTNVVSELMRAAPHRSVVAWWDEQPKSLLWTTAITVLECRFGVSRLPFGRRRDALATVCQLIFRDEFAGRILPFGEDDAEHTALLIAGRATEGRPIDLRDGMIAGMAKARNAVLATRNTRHFENSGLDLVDPWRL